MSSHSIDLSGQRTAQVTLNDPARTAYWSPAKAGDDLVFQVGGARETRIQVERAKIEKREYVRRVQRVENGKVVRDEDGAVVYDETPYVGFVLVLPGSVTMFARSSDLEATEEPTGPTPHSTLSIRRMKTAHASESGTLLGEHDLREWLDQQEAGAVDGLDD